MSSSPMGKATRRIDALNFSTEGHSYRSYTGDVAVRSPGRPFSPEQCQPHTHELFGRSGYGRGVVSRDQTTYQGSKLLQAALRGELDCAKFVAEEAARARDALQAQSRAHGPPSPSGYRMNTDQRTGELSPRSVFGMPPLGDASTSTASELPLSVFKHNQWKDRLAGGGSLPLAETAEGRKIAHFLNLFSQGNVDAINQCIAQGTSFDSTDEGGSNGLHYAARGGNLAGIKLGVTLGLSIHSTTNGGFQPIHYAALQACGEKKLTDVLQWLVMNGADLSARTTSGLTPAELAGEMGQCELVSEWLDLHGRTPKWIPSKETLENGGPSDRSFKPPCTGVCSYTKQTIY